MPANKKANLEIERKFLLKNVPNFGKRKWTSLDISQFYFNSRGKRIRYRESINKDGKSTYYSTKKKLISKGTYEEIEFIITEKKFCKILFDKTVDKRIIKKTRFIYEYKGFKFEIDKFTNMNLVVMEIELDNIYQKIPFPDFIAEKIILEVTDLREFTNFSLSEKY